MDVESIKTLIRNAFASVRFPGDSRLRGSSRGDEPFLLEQEFQGKTDWRTLDAAFLDQAADGFSTAAHAFLRQKHSGSIFPPT
ncbi:MAG: hypothetical protein U0992_12895 [Planctomycetaceae bacterium]